MTHAYDGFATLPEPLPPPMVKQTHTSKAPANQNDDYDPTAADFMAGSVEFEAREAIRSVLALYRGAAEKVMDRWFKDEQKRMRL